MAAALSRVVPVTDHPAPLTALLDGTLLPPETPLLRPDDLGVLRGEGVFETTLVVDGVARDLDDHLARLAISAEMTGLVVPAPDRWRTGVDALVEAWTGDNQMVLRLVVSRGPESAVEPVCYLLGGPLSPASRRQRTDGVRVLLLDRGFTARSAADAPWLLAGAKTLSYGVNMAALRYAAANDADDVIFLGSDGAVLEAPTASVVVANGRTLSTPPRDGILDGITVRRLFRAARDAGWTTDDAGAHQGGSACRRGSVAGVQCPAARPGDQHRGSAAGRPRPDRGDRRAAGRAGCGAVGAVAEGAGAGAGVVPVLVLVLALGLAAGLARALGAAFLTERRFCGLGANICRSRDHQSGAELVLGHAGPRRADAPEGISPRRFTKVGQAGCHPAP